MNARSIDGGRTPRATRRAASVQPQVAPAAGQRPASIGAIADVFQLPTVASRRVELSHIARSAEQLAPDVAASFRVKAPMKLGVLALAGQGGSGNVARVCARALAQAGHETFILTGRDGFWDQIQTYGAQVLPLDASPRTPQEPDVAWTGALANQLAQTAREHGLDGVMVHYAAGLLEAAVKAKQLLAAEGRHLAVSATLHGTDISTWGHHPVHGPALREQLLACDAVTAVSEWLADESVRVLDLPFRPEVIHNSIDSDAFRPSNWKVPAHEVGAGEDIRRQLAPNGEVVISHVSNFRAVKRPLDVVDAFAKIRESGIAAKLLLIGDGPMLGAVSERAVELGVGDHVVAVGPQSPDKLGRYFAASDLSFVASESESFCLAALESMACGVPVVGTRCGGLEEVLAGVDAGADGESRLLVNVGDSEGMAVAARALLTDKDRYAKAQEASVRAPFDRFPLGRQDQAYLALAETLRVS